MSRIGKKTIIVPQGVEVKKEGDEIIVRGPLGALSRFLKGDVAVEAVGNTVKVSISADAERKTKVLWGSVASHIGNMIEGVSRGFEKRLLIQGVGYKAQLKGDELILNIGFSHPVSFKLPKGVVLKIDKNTLVVSGIDKELVSSTASRIRALRKPEPYKGKGIRYENEVVRHKAGKKAAGTAA